MVSRKNLNEIDKHVGARVRMQRTMKGMSQAKLGDSLDITFQQVHKYEKGSNRIGASRLHHISELLQVPVSFFFEGAPNLEGGAAKPAAMPTLSEFENKLVILVAKVKDPKLQSKILQTVRILVGDHS